MRNYVKGETIYFKFNTRKGSDQSPITLAGTPVVKVYRDNGTTESTAGISLTVDFDSVTGLHHLTIDTSADATFYDVLYQYQAVLTAGTVDSVSVAGAVLFEFAIEFFTVTDIPDGVTLRNNAISTAKIADGAITAAKLAADAIGSTQIASGAITSAKIAADAIGATQIAANAITSAKIATDAITATQIASNAITSAKIAASAIGASQIASNAITSAKIAADSITATQIAADAITDAKVAADVTIASVTGSVGSVSSGVTVTTNNDKTDYSLSTAGIQAVWDQLLSGMAAVGSIGKKLADWVIGTAQSGDCYPDVSSGAHGNAALKTSLDNLGTSVAGLDTKLGTPSVSVSADIATRLATAGYTAPPSVAAIAAQITSDHGSGSYITATGFLTSLGTNAPAGWINAAALADAAITAAKLADNAITAAKLADNAITAAKIAANALAAAKFAADAIAAIQSGLALQNSVDTLEIEVGKVIKSGEEFTADNGTDTKDVTFTRIT